MSIYIAHRRRKTTNALLPGLSITVTCSLLPGLFTQAPPRCTKCNSPPVNGQCTNYRIAV